MNAVEGGEAREYGLRSRRKMNRFAAIKKRTKTEEQRRAQRLSLRTPTHLHFIPEGLPADPRRSPAATQIGCLTTRVLLTVHGIHRCFVECRPGSLLSLFPFGVSKEVKQKCILLEGIPSSKRFIGSQEIDFYQRAVIFGRSRSYEILEYIVAL